MTKNASRMIQSISGHRGKSCYYVLTQAVTVAIRCMPANSRMKVICTETAGDKTLFPCGSARRARYFPAAE